MFLDFLLIAKLRKKIILSNAMEKITDIQPSKSRVPQPCPETPIVFTAKSELQYIYSPYNDAKQYPPNCDCKFLIIARSAQHRIQLRVINSEMEEPLFTVCNDYCAIYDGNSDRSPRIAKWCGSNAPIQLSSSHNSIFIHFHSDDIIQKRGFNFSFLDYEVPGCPPNWLVDTNKTFCYKLENSKQSGLTWLESQTECSYENANLLTFENIEELKFIYKNFLSPIKMPWIGYNDAENEGIFSTVDTSFPVWPEKFPNFGEHNEQDCVYLDWNLKSAVYAISDCLSRRSFVCKKRLDGTTTPIYMTSEIIKNGFLNPTSLWTIFFLIFIFAILLIVIIFLLWWKNVKSKSKNQVRNSDHNQKLVCDNIEKGPPERSIIRQSLSKPKLSFSIKESHLQHQKLKVSSLQEHSKVSTVSQVLNDVNIHHKKTNEKLPCFKKSLAVFQNNPKPTTTKLVEQLERSENNHQVSSDNESQNRSPRISVTPNQPMAIWTTTNHELDSKTNQGPNEEYYELGHDDKFNNTKHGDYISSNKQTDYNKTKCESKKSKINNQKTINSLINREDTMITTTTINTIGSQGGIRTRSKQKSFNRPHVGTLDGISAISLDEFWQKNGV